jgi:hypothetical protein
MVSVLAKERWRRLELEASLRPREIPFITYTDGTSNIDDLKELAEVEVILEYIQDAEARQVAGNIAFLLDKSGMRVVRAGPTTRALRQGLTIKQSAFIPRVAPTFPGQPEGEGSPETNKPIPGQPFLSPVFDGMIASFFSSNGWAVDQGLAVREPVSPNQVLIEVGFKPSPYFRSAQRKRSDEQVAEAEQRVVPHPRRKKNNKIPAITQLPLLEQPALDCPTMSKWTAGTACGVVLLVATAFEIIPDSLNPWIVLLVKLPMEILSPLALIGLMVCLFGSSTNQQP